MSRGRAFGVATVTALAGLFAGGLLWGYLDTLEGRCRRGDGMACGTLADRERAATRGEGDLTRACDLYRRACAGGNDAGCANLGAWIGQGKCKGAQGEALDVLQRACDHGDVSGCNNLGVLLRDGAAGAPVDRARAAAQFRKACPSAAIACDNLGELLLDTDPAGAAGAFQAGCALPDGGAEGAKCCYSLGLRELDDPDPAPKARAATHFRAACDRGEAPACNNLGLMYGMGLGVTRDAAEAAKLLQKACDGGELRACANLGSRYQTGDGLPRDTARAKTLVDQACKGGVTEACVSPTP